MKFVPMILCGGAGSRLWPVSREQHPKPLIKLADGTSLLQKAFLRGATLPDCVEVITVTNRELLFQVQDEYRAVNTQQLPISLLLEPMGRNTAPALAVATLDAAARHGEDVVLLMLAADHLIQNEPAFAQAVAEAARFAQQGKLVTFGIRPTAPETGYGYIETDVSDVNAVRAFVEKPPREKAEAYVAAGNYFWNAGIFCFDAKTMLAALATHAPEVLAAARATLAASERVDAKGGAFTELDANTFRASPDISVDYAIMEKSRNVAVVPCDIGWSDIGSWTALGDLSPPDAQGNRVEGDAIIHDSRNSYVRSTDRMVGVVGVDDLLIVDTPDALLVAHRDRAQDVKHIYAKLKADGHDAHKLHRTVHRPWGTYTVLEEAPGYKMKRTVVKPGAALSLQMHQHRSEHWVVVAGTAKVTNGDKELRLERNESTYIPAGHKHRLENPGLIDLVLIEVQTGDYLGEDDIVRYSDNYGRVSTAAVTSIAAARETPKKPS
jgi:mannose-1-phosphate guanylyltransferase / mannose-6-phosphate isomerase